MAGGGIAKAIVREPLVHFLIAGACIFAGYEWTGAGRDVGDYSIEIGEGEIRQLALTWAGTRQRPPTKAEMDGLLEDRIREEILYREALRLGLDRDDMIVRRRMAAKMDYLAEQEAEADPPSDAELQAYFDDNSAKYGSGPVYDFEQIYLGRDPGSDISGLAQKLNSGAVRPEEVAVRLSLPRSFDGVGSNEIARRFGSDFAQAMIGAEQASWTGPIASGYGLHMVRIAAREQGKLPELKNIRQQVFNDWRAERIAERRAEIYSDLRRQYHVEIAPFQ